jgi:hypothetical protein
MNGGRFVISWKQVMETYATLYFTDGSRFSLRAMARVLRATDPGPDRVEQTGDDLRMFLGDWCLKIAWEKGSCRRRASVECSPDPLADHTDDYLCCMELLGEHFPGVTVYDHITRSWDWPGKGAATPPPVPSHLAGWMAGIEVWEEGTYVEGDLRCPCGGEQLQFHYLGTTHLDGISGMPIPCSAKLPAAKDGTR